MWVYHEDSGAAWNMLQVYKFDTTVEGQRWKITIKYKDIDNRDSEGIIFLSQDREILRRICKNLLNQFKEVSDAKVTTELENAIRDS